MAKAVVEKRPSRITVPEHAHPLARLVFQLMREHNVTYDELEWKSGVLRQTLKSYRVEKVPGLRTIEALLGSFGVALVPVPPLAMLNPKLREAVEAIAGEFRSEHEALASIMATVCNIPVILPPQPDGVTVEGRVTRKSVTPRQKKVVPGQVEFSLEAAA